MEKKFIVFIHTYKSKGWESILSNQLKMIKKSGLEKNAEVYICHNNNNEDTLLETWNYANKNKNKFILYLENLGVTCVGNKFEKSTSDYRNWIMDGLVNNWEKYIVNLYEGYDVCSDNYKDDIYFRDFCPEKYDEDCDYIYPRHFAAGMWWTTSKYLSSLDNPKEFINRETELPSNRLFIETWICSDKNGKFKEMRKNHSIEPNDKYKHSSLSGRYHY
tara:strand:- start:586 stop:1239 length:654 start_codon:yes stop_codon:yes gene_type:complete